LNWIPKQKPYTVKNFSMISLERIRKI